MCKFFVFLMTLLSLPWEWHQNKTLVAQDVCFILQVGKYIL
jgi:hypothetical protein